MLTVEEALRHILAEAYRLPPQAVPLEEALGYILAEDVRSDVDSPPFTKALMDGFAVRAQDFRAGLSRLKIVEEIMAGQVAQREVGEGEASRIMTGAPLPEGANAVVIVEETNVEADGSLQILAEKVSPGMNILPRGAAAQRGQLILPSGRKLRAQEIGALAEAGRAKVRVFARPRVAILATGDELVPASAIPQAGQIRNSNEPMLAAQIEQAGGEPVPLGIARDDRAHLAERIKAGLQCDMLLLSGGVSAGQKDLVPSELAAAGARQVFHKLKMKPGKPLWFGVYERKQAEEGRGRCLIFGLPGNPVSSMVCAELFARTALRRLQGMEPAEPIPVRARLKESCTIRGGRPTYHPARLDWEMNGPVVRAVDWLGSSDLRATVDANAMVLFPIGEGTFAAGETVDVFPW